MSVFDDEREAKALATELRECADAASRESRGCFGTGSSDRWDGEAYAYRDAASRIEAKARTNRKCHTIHGISRCELSAGHEGPHRDYENGEFTTPKLTPVLNSEAARTFLQALDLCQTQEMREAFIAGAFSERRNSHADGLEHAANVCDAEAGCRVDENGEAAQALKMIARRLRSLASGRRNNPTDKA